MIESMAAGARVSGQEFRAASRAHSAAVRIAVSLAIFLSVMSLQISSGVLASELSFTPDEGAHFVTGAFIFDYFRGGLHQAPLDYAVEYYQHYPKIGLGHWPPLFYVLQSVWYAAFGVHPWALVLLVGVITAATAALLFDTVSRHHGIVLGLISTTLFIVNPLVHRWTVLANADMLLTFISLVAIRVLIRFMQRRTRRDGALCLLLISLAVATKWNGLALLLALPLAVTLAGEFSLFRQRGVWWVLLTVTGTLAIVPLAAVAFGVTGFGAGVEAVTRLLAIAAHPVARLPVLSQILRVTAPGILGLAAVGAWYSLAFAGDAGSQTRIVAAATVAWFIAVALFHVISPITGEARYFLPCVVAAHVLFADGADVVRRRLSRWSAALVVAAAAATTLILDAPPISMRSGYRAVAESLPVRANGPTVVLVASDSAGESAFIAQRLAYDTARESFVLRAYTTLAEDDWQGDAYRLRLTSPAEVRAYLQSIPVHFIVVDRSPQTAPPAHIKLLTDALQSDASAFVEWQRFPLRIGESTVRDALVVYRNTASAPVSASHLRSVIPVPRGFSR